MKVLQRDGRSPTQPTKVFHQLDGRSAVSNYEASLIRKIIHDHIEATTNRIFMRMKNARVLMIATEEFKSEIKIHLVAISLVHLENNIM